MKKSIFKVLIATLLVLVLSVSAVAWFLEYEEIAPDVGGSVMTGYFYAGDGSIEHPYQLKSAKHVYNLAWLQYMGYLNQINPETNKIDQLYFELIGDIDMEGIVLPPIGTSQNPFVGHFDGNRYCISNLTISNYLSGENNELKIVQRPLGVTEIQDGSLSIVGFFGVVGAYDEDDEIADLIADDTGIEDITQKVNAVHDLFLENLTVRTETTKSLIGLVAGYANGSIMNVGVAGDSAIQLGTRTQPLNADEAGDVIYAASFYSLIGQYNATNIVWKDAPTGGTSDGEGGSGGEESSPGIGWGSTINIYEIRKRVTYITGAAGWTTVNGINYKYDVNGFGYHGQFSSTPTSWTVSYTNRGSIPALLSGTVMPLSIDQSIFETAEQSGTNNVPTLKYYAENVSTNKEAVLSTNSGYFVGGGSKYEEAYIKIISDYSLGYDDRSSNTSTSLNGWGVFKSFREKSEKQSDFPTNDGKNIVMHMLTIDPNGNTYVIQDEYNTTSTGANASGTHFSANASSYSFAAYNSATLDLKNYIKKDPTTGQDNGTGVRSLFLKGNSGAKLIHGIAFSKNIGTTLSTTRADVTLYDSKTSGTNTVKQNYELIEGAINFSLAFEGITTTVVGTYRREADFTAGVHHPTEQSLYTVFMVERDASYNITKTTVIETVHERLSPAKGEDRYVYNLGENYSDPGYKLVYNRSKMSTLTEGYALYYFEIPLNAGDYAIGMTTDSLSACLLYLDIGANGDKAPSDDGGGDEGGEEPGTAVAEHQIEGVTFVDSLAVAAKSTEGYSVVTFKVVMDNDAVGKSHGGLILVYNRTSKTNITVTETDTGDAFDVTDINDDKDLTVGIGPPSG